MRKALEADYATKQMERARQRLQGAREGQVEAIRQNQEVVRQQKKAEADELRQQRAMIQEHVAAQQSQHVARAQQINQVCSVTFAMIDSFFRVSLDSDVSVLSSADD